MPLRNPFARRSTPAGGDSYDAKNPGFERVDTIGSKASSALSVRSGNSQDMGEYELSVVNDSGVYLPPTPPEEKGQWPRRYLSRNSTETRSSSGDIEPFSISRESFDSYRRSFDISARSPVSHEVYGRQSLDAARLPRLPRSAMESKINRHSTVEESFEEVGLDDQRQQQQDKVPQQGPPRKRGFFSKFSDGQDRDASGQPVSRFHMPGRKRAQSGQGSELSSIDQSKAVASFEDRQ